jgi:hypothetical protein
MRWKLIVGNVVAVVLVGLLAWLIVRGQVADALSHDVNPTVERSVGLFDAVRTAEGDRFLRVVVDGAQQQDLQQVFSFGTASDQGNAAFAFAQSYSRTLGASFPPAHPRAADLVAVTDPDGHVLARNTDRSADRNRDLRAEYESVAYALSTGGHVTRDFLKYDQQRWFDVAMAPIVVNGQLRGLLLVGYEIADSVAAQDKQILGVDVGYLIREGNQYTLHSLSFGTQADKDVLLHWANTPGNNPAGDSPSPAHEVAINGQTYSLSSKAMPGIFHSPGGPAHAGFIVLENLTAVRAPSNTTTLAIPLLALLGLLIVVVYNTLVANYLLKPIEQIEEGLLRIINGDRDHRLEIQHAELGGIVYRVNQLVSELTGTEEEADESGRISRPPPRPQPAAPAAEGPLIDENAIGTFNAAANPADAQLAQQLSGEPENDYYERLRREYTTARQRAGLGTDGMTHEQFVESVRASEQMLAQKYALTLVRFQVQTQGGQVIFRPVPIR